VKIQKAITNAAHGTIVTNAAFELKT